MKRIQTDGRRKTKEGNMGFIRIRSRISLRLEVPKGDHPMKEVTWYGAARYCDWLSLQENPPLPRAYEHSGDWACNGGDPYGAQGYRLPTDAELEYAA